MSHRRRARDAARTPPLAVLCAATLAFLRGVIARCGGGCDGEQVMNAELAEALHMEWQLEPGGAEGRSGLSPVSGPST